ncbi:MAG: ChbG/HpnK family deacetylase [Erysipelotrichaceae bacterium]|nr:ChbG/HpnK family deacetylase [Erysipelotrichaceae bacterium]
MKLIVQGDDYGFTKGVTYGILEGIDHGVLTASGMFANMDIAPWAAKFMKERKDFCWGIDFNVVSGPSVCDPKEIPHMVDENGEFIRSGVRVKDPRFLTEEGRAEMFPYDEMYKELRGQYDRFTELTGFKPSYLHAHSISSENYVKAIHQIGEEEGIFFSQDVQEKLHFHGLHRIKKPKPNEPVKKEFDPMAQLNKDTIAQVFENEEFLLSGEYALIGGHPGYVDADLLSLTTLSLERCKDLQMILSPKIRKWIDDNHIELISYKDIVL